jgi:DNA-binding MarR family transcriptional regulator
MRSMISPFHQPRATKARNHEEVSTRNLNASLFDSKQIDHGARLRPVPALDAIRISAMTRRQMRNETAWNTALQMAAIGRRVLTLAFEVGLNPAQWGALRYFASANAIGRTLTMFATAQGTTRGTASETIRVLVAKGYLRRETDGSDGRRRMVMLTEAGRSILSRDPLIVVASAIETLPRAKQAELCKLLGCVLGQMATSRAP